MSAQPMPITQKKQLIWDHRQASTPATDERGKPLDTKPASKPPDAKSFSQTNEMHQRMEKLEQTAFDVLLTDIIMPGESDGLGLAEKASVLYPKMKILLMSGFSRETATNRGDVPWPLLVKPFHRDTLIAALG